MFLSIIGQAVLNIGKTLNMANHGCEAYVHDTNVVILVFSITSVFSRVKVVQKFPA